MLEVGFFATFPLWAYLLKAICIYEYWKKRECWVVTFSFVHHFVHSRSFFRPLVFIVAERVFYQVPSIKMKESPLGFIVRAYPETISCFGADTPISLSYISRQVSFREIMDLRLKRLLQILEPMVILVVKLILGHDHLSMKEYPRDNSHIFSRFVACLLDNSVPKEKVLALTSHLFEHDVLEGLDTILNHAILGTGMPRPGDMILFSILGETINFYPFLQDL